MPEVKLLGALREAIGGTSLRVEAREVRELLDALVTRAGQELGALLYDSRAPAEPHRDLRVLVNGRSIAFLDGLETPLSPTDRVTVHLAGARGYPGG